MNGSKQTLKRRHFDADKQVAVKKVRYVKDRIQQTKNTVAMLNELKQGLIYKLESQAGPVHAPVFTISVEVDGQKYIGQGRSKKIARVEAAATALKSFIQFKDGPLVTALKPTCNVDFTSDEYIENGIEIILGHKICTEEELLLNVKNDT